jgi:menaquinone-dependent protoporphyrinogen IX oxidase
MNSLVVYYTKTGVCKTVAENVSSILSCNTIELQDNMNFKGIIGFMKSGHYSIKKKSVSIKPISVNLTEYDNIIIISPIWAGYMTPTVRSFITQYKSDINNADIIFTSAAGNNEKAFNDFKEYFNEANYIEFTKKNVQNNNYLTDLNRFLENNKVN